MTIRPERVVADIVAAADGRLTSRVRLQKLAYLLDKIGARSGFRYSYHHYGPYAQEIGAAVFWAEGEGLVKESFCHRADDGARYSVFDLIGDRNGHTYTYLHDERSRQTAAWLAKRPVTVLELAATAHWLAAEERVPDWQAEIVRRKGWKTEDGRLGQARDVLVHLGLPPGAAFVGGSQVEAG